jgi:amino acid transporter
MGFSASLAAGLGIILSAQTLILLGNGVGQAGIWFLIFLIAGAALHLLGAFTIFADISSPRGETRFLQKNLGKWAALLLPLSSRLSLTLVATTGLVVTAGFVFNEVFVYWFPNFLFAYLLLGLILIVNLLGRVAWGRFQIFVILVTLLGLIALIIAGLFLSPLRWTPRTNLSLPPHCSRLHWWPCSFRSGMILPYLQTVRIRGDG